MLSKMPGAPSPSRKEAAATGWERAVYGHSNGGLLVEAVLTQRPDLFGAAIGN